MSDELIDVITTTLENLSTTRKDLKIMLEHPDLKKHEKMKINCMRYSAKLIIYSLKDVGRNVLDRVVSDEDDEDDDSIDEGLYIERHDIDGSKNGKRKIDSLHDFMKRAKIGSSDRSDEYPRGLPTCRFDF